MLTERQKTRIKQYIQRIEDAEEAIAGISASGTEQASFESWTVKYNKIESLEKQVGRYTYKLRQYLAQIEGLDPWAIETIYLRRRLPDDFDPRKEERGY